MSIKSILQAIINFFRPTPSDTSTSVVKNIDEAAAANPEFRNWRTSIVDLLKLTHPDDPDGASSMDSRRALARELGRPYYIGTEEENIWLHKEVMKKLVEKGIHI